MRRLTSSVVLAALLAIGSGCTSPPMSRNAMLEPLETYAQNRYYDFRDIFGIGAGITAENRFTLFPPALGLYAEATPLMHLGAIGFGGGCAELDGRASSVNVPEMRGRVGLGPRQGRFLNHKPAFGNKFKRGNTDWQRRMEENSLYKFPDIHAKDYRYGDKEFKWHWLDLPRGWQHWAWVGVEGAVSDPFFTHFGVTGRVGFDISEVSDFLLGFFGIDFKMDHVNPED